MHTFTTAGEWIYFLLILQLFWVIGVILGGVIFGIFPATYAIFAVIRKSLMKGDVRINKEFWKNYQSVFLRSQLEGWVWILVGVFIYYDVRLLFAYQNIAGFIVGSLFVSILIIYGLCTMVLLPIYFHYNLTTLNRIRLALMIVIILPYISVGLSVGSIILYFIATKIPILFMLIGITLTALLYTYLTSFAFHKVKERKVLFEDIQA